MQNTLLQDVHYKTHFVLFCGLLLSITTPRTNLKYKQRYTAQTYRPVCRLRDVTERGQGQEQ